MRGRIGRIAPIGSDGSVEGRIGRDLRLYDNESQHAADAIAAMASAAFAMHVLNRNAETLSLSRAR